MFLTQNGFLTATIALRRWLVNEQQRPDPFFGPPILQLFKGILIYHVVGAEMLFFTSQTVLALVCSTDKTEMWTFFFSCDRLPIERKIPILSYVLVLHWFWSLEFHLKVPLVYLYVSFKWFNKWEKYFLFNYKHPNYVLDFNYLTIKKRNITKNS